MPVNLQFSWPPSQLPCWLPHELALRARQPLLLLLLVLVVTRRLLLVLVVTRRLLLVLVVTRQLLLVVTRRLLLRVA